MREAKLKAITESKKTVSKRQLEKQATQVSSRGSSRAISAAHSRVASVAASDDEDDMSDATGMSMSVSSIRLDDPIEEALADPGSHGFQELLEEIVNRKGSTVAGRELALSRYISYLRNHAEIEVIEERGDQLMVAFLKSIKNEDSENEVVLALQAIAITYLTAPPEVEDDVLWTIKRCMDREGPPAVQAAAITTWGAVAAFADFGDEEMEDIMNELVVMLRDEEAIDKSTSLPFKAACEQWAFLATYIEDLEDKTDAPAEAFLRQLRIGTTEVQIAAGRAMALLYEKSHSDREANDTPLTKEELERNYEVDNQFVKRFDVCDRDVAEDILDVVSMLAGKSQESMKDKSRDDIHDLHMTFKTVLQTIEHPARGPLFRDTIDHETGKIRGNGQTKLQISKSASMYVDRWWKLIRYMALNRILRGGFLQHYEVNERVFATLPVIISQPAIRDSRGR